MEGVSGLNTVAIFYRPQTRVPCGESFEAECDVLSQDCFRLAVVPGRRFRVWDGDYIATGEVLGVHYDNWNPLGNA
jgi:hypothetical protein